MPPPTQLKLQKLETKIEKNLQIKINDDLLNENIRKKVCKEVDQVSSSIVTYAEHKFELEIS